MDNNRQALKNDIRQEIAGQQKKKKCGKCIGCGLAFLIIVVAPIVYILFLLAKSGLVNVPLLSRFFYKPLTPIRVVSVSKPINQNDLSVGKTAYNPKNGTASIVINEADLTSLVNGIVKQQNAPDFLNGAKIQVAIDENNTEVFVSKSMGGSLSTVKINLLPILRNGQLVIDIDAVLIGEVLMPKRFNDAVVKPVINGALADFMVNINKIGQIQSLNVELGQLRLVVKPSLTK